MHAPLAGRDFALEDAVLARLEAGDYKDANEMLMLAMLLPVEALERLQATTQIRLAEAKANVAAVKGQWQRALRKMPLRGATMVGVVDGGHRYGEPR